MGSIIPQFKKSASNIPNLLVVCDMRLKISVVFSDLLAQGAQSLSIILVHLLFPFFIFPKLDERRGKKGRTVI